MNTTTMISRGRRDHPGGAADPERDAAVRVAGRDPGLVHPGEQEDLVVHRQPEHDGEHQHRHERRDRQVLVDADQPRAPAQLEDRDDHAVRGTDRQQVEDAPP